MQQGHQYPYLKMMLANKRVSLREFVTELLITAIEQSFTVNDNRKKCVVSASLSPRIFAFKFLLRPSK